MNSRSPGGLAGVLDHFVPDLAAGEVEDQLLRPLLQTTGVRVFDGRPNTGVQSAPLRLEEGAVGHVLGEGVAKQIFALAALDVLVDHLDAREFGQTPLQLVLDVADSLKQLERELPADHGGRLNRPLLSLSKPVDAGREDVLHGVWHGDRRG